MEKYSTEGTVLDLLFRAAQENPSKTYCKSANHEFTYHQFISAIIKLLSEISQEKLKISMLGFHCPILSYF